ncbi:MAG: hypothetical protein A2408_01305 [Candidatus Yonathbacteria bacterium RIFOXYC1_FULL_52_10]|uniref:Ribonuclease J n=1 Tax=Candidatus Yonathbacteria bacterium RIFOXYD1_FULL_52_36 TaxID=1802730 RepID=A0A1G2SIX0_9BACT|nr:MAG: hypothetical protein A2591_03250 [Candidatus Yonathbacteria bacterium RIFOXYD1_FULL_52_36]OHA85005.1 MAG: hypothetical protein A2408_01305 [Candidatus Yonathbacteria bacterium RIFOXYC1_FULL_52_10]
MPPLEDGVVRVIPLGGVEEIGKNMTVIEYKDTIIVVDAGIQFKEESTPGIDFILPNTRYLEENRHKIKALVITHGHLDHIGAVPYLMEKMGNPPLYSRNLTTLMIRKRQEEFPHLEPLNIRIVEKDDKIPVGDMKLKFFAVTHTIPDSMGVIIETPLGNIIHTGDLKLDHENGIPSEFEENEFGKISKENNLLLMADSTNVERPGFSIPEKVVHDKLTEILKNTEGRILIAAFSSLIERLIHIINTAESLGKKIVIDGRSMKNNVEIAREAGMLTVKRDTIIPIESMDDYPPDRIVVLATGAQGDEFASLMRAANKSHKYLKIGKRDTVVLSSSIVPGNERSVQKLKDNLSRQGARLIHYQVSDVHSSGHANREETAWIHRKVGARFFVPVHGYHYMLRVHADIAKSVGTPEGNIIIPDNGMVIEFFNEGKEVRVRAESAPHNLVLVDGFSVGDLQEVVIRDRQLLAQDGIFVIVVSVETATGRVRKSPDIISRGFVYLRESQDMLRNARSITKKTIEDNTLGVKAINFDYVRDKVTDAVSRYLFQETAKRPIVLPVILGV